MTLLSRLKALDKAALAGYPRPFRYEPRGTVVMNENGMTLEVRGWGHLIGQGGGLHLTEDDAEGIQDAFGALAAETLNALPALLAVAEAAKGVMAAVDELYPGKPVAEWHPAWRAVHAALSALEVARG